MTTRHSWRKLIDGRFVGQPHVGESISTGDNQGNSMEGVLLHANGDVWQIGEQHNPRPNLPGWRTAVNLGGRGVIAEPFYSQGAPMGRGVDNRLYQYVNGRWTLSDQVGQFPENAVHHSASLGRGLDNRIWVRGYVNESYTWVELSGVSGRGRPDWVETMAIAIRGADDAVWVAEAPARDGQYGRWKSLGGQIAGNPVIIGLPYQSFPHPIMASTHLILLAHGGGDNHLWMNQCKVGSDWGSWRNLDGDFQGSPAVVAIEGTETVYCFVRGRDNQVKYLLYENGRWGEWQNLGGGVTSDPVACSLLTDDGGARIRVLALGEEGALWATTLVRN